MYDVEEEDIMKHYPQCEQFIDSSLECGGTVLIHWYDILLRLLYYIICLLVVQDNHVQYLLLLHI